MNKTKMFSSRFYNHDLEDAIPCNYTKVELKIETLSHTPNDVLFIYQALKKGQKLYL